MLLILDPQASPETLEALRNGLARLGLAPHVAGEGGGAIGIVGSVSAKAKAELAKLPGVRKVVPVAEPYRLASRVFHPAPTVVQVGRAQVGGRGVVMMAGPCSVESREHILEMARLVKEAGIPVLRGGAYKPRTSPYAFQGLGEKGLDYLKEAGEKSGLAPSARSWTPASSRPCWRPSTCSRWGPGTCRTSPCSRPWASSASRCS